MGKRRSAAQSIPAHLLDHGAGAGAGGGAGDGLRRALLAAGVELAPQRKPGARFTAIPTCIDGHRFPSRAEARRYGELKLLQLGHLIADLELQPEWTFTINGQPVLTAGGRPLRYRADFRYRDLTTGELVVEDVKGGFAFSRDAAIRIALMQSVHGITVRLVGKPRTRRPRR